MSKALKKPTIMVSSTVYGIEELLDRIYTLLTTFGYDVWMSHKGTLPVQSRHTAFENCLRAVELCDVFLGIITPTYGSGKDGEDISIVHKEIQKAIALKKPRWLLAHSDVVFARRLLRELGYGDAEERKKLILKKGATALTDLRVISLYEEATLQPLPLAERHGNWTQEFRANEDALLFASAQFSRFQEVEQFISENLADSATVGKTAKAHRESRP